MLVHRKVTPSIKFAGTHLYTWVERGTVRVKCLAHEHNTMFSGRQGPEPRLLDPESSSLTMKPPCLPLKILYNNYRYVFLATKKWKLTTTDQSLLIDD